jgi:hypothetical protein
VNISQLKLRSEKFDDDYDDDDNDNDDDDNNNNNNNNNNNAPSWLRRLVAGLPLRHRGTIPDQSMRDLW